jgi:MFS transporter, DHA1 family, inner membrane transport protein
MDVPSETSFPASRDNPYAAPQAPLAEAVASPVFRERLILFMLIIVQFTSIVDFMVVIPLAPQLRPAFDLTPGEFGWIVASYTFAAGIVALLLSPILDRFGRRTAFTTLYAGFLLGTLACGLAPSYYTLLAARFITGAFGGLLGGIALAIVGDVFPEHRRGRASGALMAAFALASVFGVPIGLSLGQHFGWHTPFFVIAGLGLPILVMALRVLPRLDAHRQTQKKETFTEYLREMFLNRNHQWAFALTVSMQFGGFLIVTNLSDYLVNNVKVDPHNLPYIYTLGGIMTLIGSPIIGRISDRLGKPPVYRVMAIAAAIVYLTITHLPPVHFAWAMISMALLMLCNGGRMVPAMAMITSSVEPARRGSFLGAYSAVQHLSAGLGSYVAGKLLSTNAQQEFVGYNHVGYVAVAATILSVWIASKLRIYEAPLMMAESATTMEDSIAAAAQGSADTTDTFLIECESTR